jgi:hypothetical protein
MMVFMYIGFWWDLEAKKIKLLEKKKVKYLDRIADWMQGLVHGAKEAEKVR